MVFLRGLRGALEIVGVILACMLVGGTGLLLVARWLTWFMEQLA